MTGRALLLAGGAAVTLAAAGLLARPLLPAAGPPSGDASVAMTVGEPVPPRLLALAEHAAHAATGCHGVSARRAARGCGRLTVTGTEASRTGGSHVTVRLTGRLATTAAPAMAVALRVELTRSAAGWSTAVSSP